MLPTRFRWQRVRRNLPRRKILHNQVFLLSLPCYCHTPFFTITNASLFTGAGGDDDDNNGTKEVHGNTPDGGSSFPAMSMVKQFAPTLVYMVASRYIAKLDFTNPAIIQLCRVVFAVYLLLSQGK